MQGALHLVADVGGTNCRLAVADATGVRTQTARRFRNDDYASFADLARVYLADQPQMTSAAVAIAGPVGKGWGRLTNRDWHFDATDLARDLSIETAYLLNDLEALGHAIGVLPRASLRHLSGTPVENEQQSIVVGLGTGFNVSAAHVPSGVVLAAEMGHASLPQSVAAIIHEAVGDTHGFDTVEHLFSGRGLANLHAVRTGQNCKPEDVAEAEGGADTQIIMARALGYLLREIAYLYLPEGGVYFNGSLARTLLAQTTAHLVLAPLQEDASFHGRIASIPVYLLTDDASALYGCARYLALHP